MPATKGLFRSFKVVRDAINKEKRTVELAFSSETPVERWGENEVLSHDESDVDLERFKSGTHPLLLGHAEHDPDSQIGVIESARIDRDKVGRAVVRFGNSPKANEIFQDVVDGIRQNVSVGYDTTGIVKSDKAADGRITTRYKWAPTHIGIVPVPADTAAGIGRSNTDKFDKSNLVEIAKNLTPEQKMNLRSLLLDPAAIDPTGGVKIDVKEIEQKTRTATAGEFKTRAKEITAIADGLIDSHGDKVEADGKPMREKIRKLASEALQSDESLSDFKVRCMVDILKATPAKQLSMRASGMSEKDEESYSLMKGIQSAAENKRRGAEPIPDDKTLEGEFHRWVVKEQAKSGGFGYEQSGFVMPFDYQIRGADGSFKTRKQRDMQAEVFAQGGAFVPTQLVTPPIEILRNMEVLSQLGVREMAGLQGNIVIPRQDAAATAYAVSEIGALTASGQILGQLALTPKRVGATQPYSKQFVFQSTPDAETFLRDDLFKVIALQRDRLGLNGQGANSEPLGVMNTPGVQSLVFGATPTWKQIVQMETNILSANVVGELAYVSTPATRGSLKTVAVALTGATTIGGAMNAIWFDGEMNDYEAIASNQIPNNQVILGHWPDLISAAWNGFDVVVDYVTKAANAEIVITINIWCDFALRHPQAFCVSSDSGAQ